MTTSPFSESFTTWATLLDHVAAEYPLAYQAPLDARPVVVTVVRRRDGKLRVTPSFSDADPFTADAGHLSRFRRRPVNTYQTAEHCHYCGNTWQATRKLGARHEPVTCPSCKRSI